MVSAGDTVIWGAQLGWNIHDGLLTWPAAGVSWTLRWDCQAECLTSYPCDFSVEPEFLIAWQLGSERQEVETAQKSQDIISGAF